MAPGENLDSVVRYFVVVGLGRIVGGGGSGEGGKWIQKVGLEKTETPNTSRSYSPLSTLSTNSRASTSQNCY